MRGWIPSVVREDEGRWISLTQSANSVRSRGDLEIISSPGLAHEASRAIMGNSSFTYPTWVVPDLLAGSRISPVRAIGSGPYKLWGLNRFKFEWKNGERFVRVLPPTPSAPSIRIRLTPISRPHTIGSGIREGLRRYLGSLAPFKRDCVTGDMSGFLEVNQCLLTGRKAYVSVFGYRRQKFLDVRHYFKVGVVRKVPQFRFLRSGRWRRPISFSGSRVALGDLL